MDRKIKYEPFLKTIKLLLIIILMIKLAGFFTWSQSIGITRVIKIVSRLVMTFAIFEVYRSICRKGAVASIKWFHTGAPLFYCAYLILGFISLWWSSDATYSSLQWFMDVECFVFAYYFILCFILLENFFPESDIRLTEVIAEAIFYIMLVFVIGQYADPDQFYRLMHDGDEARLGGYIMNPNELGMLSALGVSCYIFSLYKKKNRIIISLKIFILLYAIIMTGSRSTTIGCMLIAFFHIRQSSNKKIKLAMYAAAIAVIPLAITKMIVKENAGGLDEVLSMTGRVPFWHALLTEGLPKEPLFGFGFMRIAYKDNFSSLHTYSAGMTHNTFIQVLMNLGIIGFIIIIFQLVFTIRGYLKFTHNEKRLMFIGIIIPVMINSFTEFGIFGETNYGILFYQLLIIYLSLSINPKLTPAEKIYIKKQRPDWNTAFFKEKFLLQ